MAGRSFWVLFGAAAVAVVVGAYLYDPEVSWAPGRGASASAATSSGSNQAVVVEVEQVTTATVEEDVRAVGTLQPNESVVIAPEIAGRLLAIRFREGDRVEEGEVLVEIDAEILRAELEKAQSDLILAQANNERAATLASQGTGTLRARDEAAAVLRAAEAELSLAEARLEKATIRAPFPGVVGLRSVSVGAYLTPGTPIVTLAEIDPLKVEFRVPELQLPRLRQGQSIVVTADAIPGRSFEGTVYAIDPVVDIDGRAIRSRATVPNPERLLSPGLFARIRIIVEERPGALLVPESAIVADAGKTFVFRVADGQAERVEVSLGERLPGRVEVRSGLRAGDTVIAAGHQRVRAGSRLEIVAARAGS